MTRKPLTPEMAAAVEKIEANGGRVGNWLTAYKAIGTNGRAVNGLLKRGIAVRHTFDGSVYIMLAERN